MVFPRVCTKLARFASVFLVVLIALQSGCGWAGFVYRPVSSKIDKVEQGMTKKEVFEILGEPDKGYQSNRWIYTQYCRQFGLGGSLGRGCDGNVVSDFMERMFVGTFFFGLGHVLIPKEHIYYFEFDNYERLRGWASDWGQDF